MIDKGLPQRGFAVGERRWVQFQIQERKMGICSQGAEWRGSVDER